MALFDEGWMKRWQGMVNQDKVAALYGRHFTANVLFEFGDRNYVVAFERGAVTSIQPEIGPETTYDFALRAPAESWSKFVQAIPPPMYNDIWAMAHPLHGRLKIEGNVKIMWQNLRAFTWALELMRAASE